MQREWANLQAAVSKVVSNGLLSLQLLEDARLSSLHRQLDQGLYHIIHFIGHGVFNEQKESGELILEDTEGRGRSVSAEQFGSIISDHNSLRLVVLNSCEGARNGRTDPFSGTAQTLVLQGVPSVIAMQWEITDEAAISFATAFYSAIASGLPIDRGVSYARRALYADGAETEWATPVLYLRSSDGLIFNIEATNAAQTARVDEVKHQVELEAHRQSEEQRRVEEAARQEEEQRKVEEARQAEQRKTEEAARLAEASRLAEKRKTDEAARVAEEFAQGRRGRSAGGGDAQGRRGRPARRGDAQGRRGRPARRGDAQGRGGRPAGA